MLERIFKLSFMNRFGFLEKVSFRLIKWIGSPASLLFHTALFVGFLISRYLGIIGDYTFSFLIATVCLEAIYLAIFVQLIVKNNCKNLLQMQGSINKVCQEEKDAHKLMLNVLHLSHQMKTLQQEIENLKKHGIIKPIAQNGQRVHI